VQQNTALPFGEAGSPDAGLVPLLIIEEINYSPKKESS